MDDWLEHLSADVGVEGWASLPEGFVEPSFGEEPPSCGSEEPPSLAVPESGSSVWVRVTVVVQAIAVKVRAMAQTGKRDSFT
jgi:hypothetical protein